MNSNPNILLYRPDGTKEYENVLRKAGFTSVESATSKKEAREKLSGTEVLFCWKFPTYLLSLPNANSVRWIQSMGAGVDDLVSDKNIPKDILLTRIVDQFGAQISEYTFAYLLYITQEIHRTRKAQKERSWEVFLPDFLFGKKIGIAGLGSIGAELVRRAKAFDMVTYGLSYSGKNAGLVDKHFYSSEWFSFVNELDILVLTLPLTKETNQIVSEEILQNMKQGSVLVNVGRGQLVDEDALTFALRSGKLGGAILDVFQTEPLPSESKFWSFSNVFVTPHLAGPSIAANVGRFFVENLKRYISSKPLKGVIHRDKGF